jgi:tetratricopeptide (TPR) repeat protein
MYLAGHAKLHIGSYEPAIAWFRQAIEANRNYSNSHFELAAALAMLGRVGEAHSAAQAGLALNPAFTIARARAAWTALSDDPTFLAQLRDEIFDGMRKAGMREG